MTGLGLETAVSKSAKTIVLHRPGVLRERVEAVETAVTNVGLDVWFLV